MSREQDVVRIILILAVLASLVGLCGSGALAVDETDHTAIVKESKCIVESFFGLLNGERYEEAALLYGGGYGVLQS